MDVKVLENAGIIIGAAIVFIANKAIDWYKNSTMSSKFRKQLNKENKVSDELSYIRDRFGFNRVVLIDYHNGTESLNGFSFKNASVRYEKLDVKTGSIIKNYQNVPTSIQCNFLNRLESSKDGYEITDDVTDDEMSIANKMFGIKHSYNFKIGKSLITGVLSLQSTNEVIELNHDEINEIKAICQRILLIRRK